MKKISLVLVLTVLVTVGSVFADHPGGLGIGPVWQYGKNFDKGSKNSSHLALALKAPSIPIYWGFSFDLDYIDYGISFGITGDKYLFDNTLVKDINLGWYLGLGGYGRVMMPDHSDGMYLGIGARLPIGLYIIPLDFLEIFFDIAPSLGFKMETWKGGKSGLTGAYQADFGLRFWL
jgi:hypothetical protein